MTENMKIWDAVSKTDPRHTKKVEFGRKFTSIDAHWQIMRATEQFGPVGEGWTYKVVHSIERLADTMVLAVADVTIYWSKAAGEPPCFYGPIRATAEIYSPDKSGKMRVDDDAPKKAMTDALTKGLSHLGFSADVFMGKFDDNKYVQQVTAEFNQTLAQPAQERDVADGAREFVSKSKADLSIMTLSADVRNWWKAKNKALAKLESNFPDLYIDLHDAYNEAMDRVERP